MVLGASSPYSCSSLTTIRSRPEAAASSSADKLVPPAPDDAAGGAGREGADPAGARPPGLPRDLGVRGEAAGRAAGSGSGPLLGSFGPADPPRDEPDPLGTEPDATVPEVAVPEVAVPAPIPAAWPCSDPLAGSPGGVLDLDGVPLSSSSRTGPRSGPRRADPADRVGLRDEGPGELPAPVLTGTDGSSTNSVPASIPGRAEPSPTTESGPSPAGWALAGLDRPSESALTRWPTSTGSPVRD